LQPPTLLPRICGPLRIPSCPFFCPLLILFLATVLFYFCFPYRCSVLRFFVLKFSLSFIVLAFLPVRSFRLCSRAVSPDSLFQLPSPSFLPFFSPFIFLQYYPLAVNDVVFLLSVLCLLRGPFPTLSFSFALWSF